MGACYRSEAALRPSPSHSSAQAPAFILWGVAPSPEGLEPATHNASQGSAPPMPELLFFSPAVVLWNQGFDICGLPDEKGNRKKKTQMRSNDFQTHFNTFEFLFVRKVTFGVMRVSLMSLLNAFSSLSSVTDSLNIRHINEAFSIHNHVALIGHAWEFLHQVWHVKSCGAKGWENCSLTALRHDDNPPLTWLVLGLYLGDADSPSKLNIFSCVCFQTQPDDMKLNPSLIKVSVETQAGGVPLPILREELEANYIHTSPLLCHSLQGHREVQFVIFPQLAEFTVY